METLLFIAAVGAGAWYLSKRPASSGSLAAAAPPGSTPSIFNVELQELDPDNPHDKVDLAGDVSNDEKDWFFLDYPTAYSQEGWDLFYRQVYRPASLVTLEMILLSPEIQNISRAFLDPNFFWQYNTAEIALGTISDENTTPTGKLWIPMNGDNVSGAWLNATTYGDVKKNGARWSGSEMLADWRNWRVVRNKDWLTASMTGGEAFGAGTLDFLHGVGNALTFGTGGVVHGVISGAAGSSSVGGDPVRDQVAKRSRETAGAWGERVAQIGNSAPAYDRFLRAFLGPVSTVGTKDISTLLTDQWETDSDRRHRGVFDKEPFDPRDGTPYMEARRNRYMYELGPAFERFGPNTPPTGAPILRATSGGKTFYERHGFLHPRSPANVWNSENLTLHPFKSDYLTPKADRSAPGAGSTLRERVNKRARLYRALDLMAAIMYPDAAPPAGTFSYTLGPFRVGGATLPAIPSAESREAAKNMVATTLAAPVFSGAVTGVLSEGKGRAALTTRFKYDPNA